MNGFKQNNFMNLFNEFSKFFLQNQSNNMNGMNMRNNINGMNMSNNMNGMNMNNNINGMNMKNNMNGMNMRNNMNGMNMSNNMNGMNMSNNMNGMNMSNNMNGMNMNNNINCYNKNNNNINHIFRRKHISCMKLNRNISDINMNMNMNMNNNLNRMNMNMNNNINFNNMNNMNMNNNIKFKNNNNMNNLRYNYTCQNFDCLNDNNFNNNMNQFSNRGIINNLKINFVNNNFSPTNSIHSLSNRFQNLNLNNNINCNNSINFNNRNFICPTTKNSASNFNMLNFNQINNFCTNNNNININNSSNINNTQITMKFSFYGNIVILVKAKLTEKFCDVIKRFKENECPRDLRNDLSVALHSGEVIKDRNKTLSELNIKDGEIILFIIKVKKEKNTTYGNKVKTLKLSEDERIQVKKWLIEYKKMKYINEMVNNQKNIENNKNLLVLNNRESLYNFMEFIRQKERQGFIKVKEHKHKLVYCLTIFDWKCNLCNRKYNKENARYYCSICDFNMCDNCHSKGEYIKKKAFPEGVEPTNKMVNKKYFETDYHHHRLVYCRSSRSVIGYNGWICDNCRDQFDNDVWSFFCTNCDFDLCCSCLGYNS